MSPMTQLFSVLSPTIWERSECPLAEWGMVRMLTLRHSQFVFSVWRHCCCYSTTKSIQAARKWGIAALLLQCKWLQKSILKQLVAEALRDQLSNFTVITLRVDPCPPVGRQRINLIIMIVLGWCDLISNYAMCPGYQNYWQGFPKLLWLPELLARLAKIIGRRLPEVPPPHCCSINCSTDALTILSLVVYLIPPTSLQKNRPRFPGSDVLSHLHDHRWQWCPEEKNIPAFERKNDHRRSLSDVLLDRIRPVRLWLLYLNPRIRDSSYCCVTKNPGIKDTFRCPVNRTF